MSGRRRQVWVNFENVEFLSSKVLGKLIALHKKLGVRLILANVDPEIYEAFEITHLDRFFDIRLKGENDFPAELSSEGEVDFQAEFGDVGSILKFPKPSGSPISRLPPRLLRVFQRLWSFICRPWRKRGLP